MALADLFKLHDPALADQFNEKAYDATKDRKAFKKSLDDVLDQMNNGRTKGPNRMWVVANEIVEFKPTYKKRPVAILGESTFYIPQNHFAQAIETIKTSVDAGELDAFFEGNGNADGSSSTASRGTATKSKRGTGIGNVAKPDDPEWMAKFTAWAEPPSADMVDPVPNSTATKWVPKAFAERGRKAKATGSKKA